LKAAGVARILHAGDVSSQAVLDELAQVAPVDVARGNRDWFLRGRPGWVSFIELGGVRVALMHGHGSWARYLIDKWFYTMQGYRFERYRSLMLREGQDARVIVFGHTHRRENVWIDGHLLFNPGSAAIRSRQGGDPSWGLLSIFTDGTVEGDIFELKGYQLKRGRWVAK